MYESVLNANTLTHFIYDNDFVRTQASDLGPQNNNSIVWNNRNLRTIAGSAETGSYKKTSV